MILLCYGVLKVRKTGEHAMLIHCSLSLHLSCQIEKGLLLGTVITDALLAIKIGKK